MRRVGYVVAGLLCLTLSLAPVKVFAEDTSEGTPSLDPLYSNNDILYYDPTALPCVTAVDQTATSDSTADQFDKPGDLTLTGANNAEKVMNFLLGQGFNLGAASGMMGNFSVESGFNPEALNGGSGAYGLAQWLGSRKTELQSYGGDVHNTLEVQVQFLMHELATSENAAMAVKNQTLPAQAALVWEKLFERSGAAALGERSNRAEKIFSQWTKTKTLPDKFLATIGNNNGGETTGSVTETTNLCRAAAGSGVLGAGELEGYAFPIAAKSKKSLSSFGGALNLLPCTGICHHDKSYAFDIGVTGYGEQDSQFNPNSIGAPVYAISDGTITNRHDNPNSVRQNCTQYTLKSSKDGYSWWYGHLALKGAAVQSGQEVKAGQILGYVGHSNCADNTAPHLHIDSGGGIVGQRNPQVSKVINGLYAQLPDN